MSSFEQSVLTRVKRHNIAEDGLFLNPDNITKHVNFLMALWFHVLDYTFSVGI
jgi:hypothetical protein